MDGRVLVVGVVIFGFIAVLGSWTAFILPLIIGPLIWFKFRSDDTSRAAAVLTLKPIVATFLLGASIALIYQKNAVNLTFLPGLLLTLVIVVKFRRLFRSAPVVFALLLAADAVRWLYTFFMYSPWSGEPPDDLSPAVGPLFAFALFLPNAYAVLALAVAMVRARQRMAALPPPKRLFDR